MRVKIRWDMRCGWHTALVPFGLWSPGVRGSVGSRVPLNINKNTWIVENMLTYHVLLVSAKQNIFGTGDVHGPKQACFAAVFVTVFDSYAD